MEELENIILRLALGIVNPGCVISAPRGSVTDSAARANAANRAASASEREARFDDGPVAGALGSDGAAESVADPQRIVSSRGESSGLGVSMLD
jgi:hypothetical protein